MRWNNLFSTKPKILLCLWPTSVLGFCGRFWYIPEVASRPRRPPELALIHQIWRFLQSDTGSKSSIKSKGVYKWRKFREWRGNLAGSMSKAMNSQVKMPASIVEDNFRKVAASYSVEFRNSSPCIFDSDNKKLHGFRSLLILSHKLTCAIRWCGIPPKTLHIPCDKENENYLYWH